jgi:beta-glucanase (GH16 family)
MNRYFILFLLLVTTFSCKEDESTVVTGFSIDKNSLTEGATTNIQIITLTLEGKVVGELSVPYEIKGGTAINGTDLSTSQGELKFNSSTLSVEVPVNIIGDTNLEITETFYLNIQYQGKLFEFPIDILDDDPIEDITSDADGFITPSSYTSMNLIWSDEFNEAELNTSNWSYEIGNGCSAGICGWGNNELESYTSNSENVKLENGKLVITAIDNGGSYTSARIKTQDKQEIKFGRIDIRARLPKGQGIWPALWMLGENIDQPGTGWPICGEIDIMELVGHKPAEVVGTVHYNNDGYKYSSSSSTLSSGDFSGEFHVFTIVWDHNKISWYVDNKIFKTFSNSNISGYPFNKAFFFILNVAVGGNWPGPPDQTTVFPQQMLVDYIRVFQ